MTTVRGLLRPPPVPTLFFGFAFTHSVHPCVLMVIVRSFAGTLPHETVGKVSPRTAADVRSERSAVSCRCAIAWRDDKFSQITGPASFTGRSVRHSKAQNTEGW